MSSSRILRQRLNFCEGPRFSLSMIGIRARRAATLIWDTEEVDVVGEGDAGSASIVPDVDRSGVGGSGVESSAEGSNTEASAVGVCSSGAEKSVGGMGAGANGGVPKPDRSVGLSVLAGSGLMGGRSGIVFGNGPIGSPSSPVSPSGIVDGAATGSEKTGSFFVAPAISSIAFCKSSLSVV